MLQRRTIRIGAMLGATVMAAILAPRAAAQMAAAKEGVAALDEAWIKAAKAGDVEGLVALYAPDAVMYAPDAMELRGTAAIREYYAGMMKMVTVKDMKVSGSQYHTSGDVSFGWFRWTMVAVPSDSPDPMTIDGRATAFARKMGGKWLYVNDHASVLAPAPPQAPSTKGGSPAK